MPGENIKRKKEKNIIETYNKNRSINKSFGLILVSLIENFY